jgi:hypothetical protein
MEESQTVRSLRWWKSWPFISWLFEITPFWSDLGGRVRWWKSWPFFIWLFEIPPFWSYLGSPDPSSQIWSEWRNLKQSNKKGHDFHHLKLLPKSDQNGGISNSEIKKVHEFITSAFRPNLIIVTFFYLTVWDSSILIIFGEEFEVMKSVTFFIWLFEIPPFWSDLGRGLRWWKSWPLLFDCDQNEGILNSQIKKVTIFITSNSSPNLIRMEESQTVR